MVGRVNQVGRNTGEPDISSRKKKKRKGRTSASKKKKMIKKRLEEGEL